jgi:hypothetical protein
MATVKRCGFALLMGCALGLLAPAAGAGIYKCTSADGSVHYTSDASHCESAEPQVLKRDLQRVLTDDTSRGAGMRPAARRPAGGDGLEAMWRSKRPKAEQDLAELEKKLARMKNVVRSCNRGGEWYRTSESGIREHVSCDELHAQYAELQQEHQKLVEYLADGLEDECRRAGCQPGWIR